ncbi:MAG: hypothetical protein HRJ53_07695 [Acidobacteria bacterium Pan2503]|uniref:Uncharacterized protein n=1 Tax=Candidatus Acidiferrum panamense TaxID=2741543 RepID=A0A7V8NP00_9BACT|nr:hypothetical protein [Candidatus Acidoferrum panamensis]
MPSPPTVQAVRCKLDYLNDDGSLAGSRFYLSYTGSAPSPANCATLANDIVTAWNAHIGPILTIHVTLNEVDVLDLASTSGASGQSTTTATGGATDPAPPSSVAVNVEFNIARRYRGGKPRMYFPATNNANLANQRNWTSGFVSTFNSDVTAFFAALEALTIGSMGTLAHVNISFYHGHNTSQPPWRGPGYKYPPLYRGTALVDPIESYSTKTVIGSQRRRRTATTP